MTTATITNGGRTVDHTAYPASCRRMRSEELVYVIADCRAALAAHPESANAGRYADEICYAAAELKRRGR